MRFLVVALALTCGSCGPASHDCNVSEFERGLRIATEHFYTPTLDHLDLFCSTPEEMLSIYRYDVDCFTVSRAVFPNRGRYIALHGLEAPCVVHEQYHNYLENEEGWEPCYSHKIECGWDAKLMDRIMEEE